HVDCPVWTTELSPYFFEAARLRFEDDRSLGLLWAHRLTLAELDSVTFLTDLFARTPAHDDLAFFYLDAHGDYVQGVRPPPPVFRELALIRAARTRCIVMIDDVPLPDDPGYAGADDLALGHLRPLMAQFDAVFLPLAASHDTGALRGSVVLSGSRDTT